MNRETFTRLVRKELSGLRRFLMAACSGNGDEADDIAPFNMRPLTDFIKKIVEEIDSVKVYETCYEVTSEDFEGNPSLVGECYPDEEHSYCGKTTGRLYVVPESSAKDVLEMFSPASAALI